jgi:hypothetical protein
MKRFVIGLDLGLRQDYSALAIDEHSVRNVKSRRPEHLHDLRHLERFTLGTSYAEVVDAVVKLVLSPLVQSRPTVLAVDATGVGRPVVEALSARLPRRRGFTLLPITITGGDQPNSHNEASWRWWNVPKRDLVSTVALALEQTRMKGEEDARRLLVAPTLAEARTLVSELRAFRVTITATANDTYGAWRERDHDDLVLAVACAVWAAEHEWHRPARITRATGAIHSGIGGTRFETRGLRR